MKPSLKAWLASLKAPTKSGDVAASSLVYAAGIRAGTLIELPEGETVTVHKTVAVPGLPKTYMTTVTYQGQDLMRSPSTTPSSPKLYEPERQAGSLIAPLISDSELKPIIRPPISLQIS
jgi:hypothetical protein